MCSCTHGGHLSYQLLSSFKDVNSPHNQISDAGPPCEVGLCWQEHADCGFFSAQTHVGSEPAQHLIPEICCHKVPLSQKHDPEGFY